MDQRNHSKGTRSGALPLYLSLGISLIYYLSNPTPSDHFDYTFRIAEALLRGKLGLTEPPPSWLNEMVPYGNRFYSVFPLGSVLTMVPFALLKFAHAIESFPARVIGALISGATTLFFFLLSSKYGDELPRRLILVLFPALGTWMWCNLVFAGAWQVALGFAVLGQAGALYFTTIKVRPLVAGFFFALAYGNRTEVILTAPLLIYLLVQDSNNSPETPAESAKKRNHEYRPLQTDVHRSTLCTTAGIERIFSCLNAFKARRRAIILFLFFPFILGMLTLAYNYARFHSFADFGYARIPGVLNEEWYRQGIFSVYAIPRNAEKMLVEPWRWVGRFPYLRPTGWGDSIFISSPFLFLLFRRRTRDRRLKVVAWFAIATLTLVLWCHGNPGGWQFSYRYAMVLLPWMFVILLENGTKKASVIEVVLLIVSITVNAYATYLFFWTNYVGL